MLWNEDQLPRVKREREPMLRGKLGESIFGGKHTDNVQKETHVVSVMTLQPLETRSKVRDGQSSSPASYWKAKRTDREEHKSSL